MLRNLLSLLIVKKHTVSLILKLGLTYASLMFLSIQSQAYAPACHSLFSSKSSLTADQATEKILHSIENYKQLMSLNDIRHSPQALDQIKQKLKVLSPKQKNYLKQLVRHIYTDVKLQKYSKTGPIKSFKRHLDLIITEEINASELFRQAVYKDMLSVESALNDYFKTVNEWTKTESVLEAKDLVYALIQLQYNFIKSEDRSEFIVVYGSLANGKAFPHLSDLDFAVGNGQMEQRLKEANLLDILSDFPLSDAQSHMVKYNRISELGYMNPLVVVIHKNYIEIRIYERALQQDYRNNKVRFDQYYL